MNFLAHAYLSFDLPHIVAGNFLGDFLRHAETLSLPLPVYEGLMLHRKIDHFTDNHPVVKKDTARMRPYHRKYAPVVVDMYYDYLLASHWRNFHDLPLPVFSRKIYRILESHLHLMPERLRERVPFMIKADWLSSYGTKEGMLFAFERLQHRASRPEWLANAFQNLLDNWKPFEADFMEFFPELAAFARVEIGLQP